MISLHVQNVNWKVLQTQLHRMSNKEEFKIRHFAEETNKLCSLILVWGSYFLPLHSHQAFKFSRHEILPLARRWSDRPKVAGWSWCQYFSGHIRHYSTNKIIHISAVCCCHMAMKSWQNFLFHFHGKASWTNKLEENQAFPWLY